MTIREATATGDSVMVIPALVSSFEALLITSIASAVNQFREDWMSCKMTDAEAVHGRVVLEPFVFARIAQAFGHTRLKDTVDYVTAVTTSAGVIDRSLTLKARSHHRPALNPLQAAQYSNAYQLVLCK